MVDQFKAEKCLQAASTDNLVLMIIDNSSDPRAAPRQPLGQTPGNSDGTNPGTPAESRCKTPGVALGGGGCWRLELTDCFFKRLYPLDKSQCQAVSGKCS